ncbi:MAG: response regulator transcription factor [Chloroflexota bacterium]
MENQNSMIPAQRKLLIVDDHVLFREGLISLFRNTSDFEVVGGAGSVFDAIEMARKFRPDVILMDFSMPDGTGLDATWAILSELPDCKIVFLTMHETDEKLFEALRAGAKGYMPKNTPSQDLISSLRALKSGEMALSRRLMSRVVDEFSKGNKPEVDIKVLSKLSTREMDVLRELANGGSNQEIAKRLFLSENTVKHHIHSVFEKLGVENRRQAIVIANQHKLVR